MSWWAFGKLSRRRRDREKTRLFNSNTNGSQMFTCLRITWGGKSVKNTDFQTSSSWMHSEDCQRWIRFISRANWVTLDGIHASVPLNLVESPFLVLLWKHVRCFFWSSQYLGLNPDLTHKNFGCRIYSQASSGFEPMCGLWRPKKYYQVSHYGQPRFKGTEIRLHLLTAGRARLCSHLFFKEIYFYNMVLLLGTWTCFYLATPNNRT